MDFKNYEELLAKMDGMYEKFPVASDWKRVSVNEHLWNLRETEIKALKESFAGKTWDRATDYALRAAAVDTGAIEGLYTTTRGITLSIATQAYAIDAESQKKYNEIKEFFEAQLKGYELTLDAINNWNPISEAWIRALHETLTAGQEDYEVVTPVGK